MPAKLPAAAPRLIRLAALATAVALSACGGDGDAPPPPAPAPAPAPSPPPPPASGTLVPASVTLLAGGGGTAAGGDCGDADGVGDQARLGVARDMAVGPDGTVHVLERSCDLRLTRVRSISPAGAVRTSAVSSSEPVVSGGPLPSSFLNGKSLAAGDSGAVYVVDGSDSGFMGKYPVLGPASGVWKVTAAGAEPFAGLRSAMPPFVDGVGLQAQFVDAERVVFGQGALYVLDSGRVRRVTEDAVVTTVTPSLTPDAVDNAGALYHQGDSAWQRLDGTRTIPFDGLRAPYAIGADGALFGLQLANNLGAMRIARRNADGTQLILVSTPAPPWQTVRSDISATLVALDRAGQLYVLYSRQLWRVSFD